MIEIINNYTPNKICKKLINIICKKVNKSKLYKNYNFSYHTQKYKLKDIVTKIMYCLHKCKDWRQLGIGWNNIYKHFIKLSLIGIFKNTYLELLKMYIKKHKTSLKIVSLDTTTVYNKYGYFQAKLENKR